MTETATAAADVASDLSRLAEFVGRLYLLLITIVCDHRRWLPRNLRRQYASALLEAYPSVQRLQAALLDPGATDMAQRLTDAGLSGSQLELKLDAYRRAEARFYGRRAEAEAPPPDRRFGELREQVWVLPESPPESLEEQTSGSKHPRARALAETALEAGDVILGTLLSVFQVGEAYKEIKEGILFGIKSSKLVRRARDGAAWAWTKVRGG